MQVQGRNASSSAGGRARAVAALVVAAACAHEGHGGTGSSPVGDAAEAGDGAAADNGDAGERDERLGEDVLVDGDGGVEDARPVPSSEGCVASRAAALGTTYWVDGSAASGADEGPGSEAEPFLTLSRAAAVAGPGDVVLVRAGRYAEPLVPTRSGTRERPLVFRAAPGDECQGPCGGPKHGCAVVIDGAGADGSGVDLSGTGHVRVEGLEITGWGSDAVYLASYYDEGVEGASLVNNHIHHNAGNGVYRNARGLLVENNEIDSNGMSAMDLGGEEHVIRRNFIHYNAKDGLSGDAANVLFEENVLFDQFHTAAHQDGLQLDGIRGWVIRNNVLWDFTQLIYGSDYRDVRIYGNVLYTDRYATEAGGLAPGIFIVGGEDLEIHSNTCGWLGLPCIRVYGDVRGLRVRNNLMVDSGLDLDVDDPHEVDSDYNLVFDSDPTDATTLEGRGGWAHAEGPHTLHVDPLLVGYERHASHDFSLDPASPARDRGDPALADAVTLPAAFVDLVGVRRPAGAGYDLGALERNVP